MKDIHGLSGPSPWVRRYGPVIAAGGRVLDLACGGGRHARYLAALGYEVLAVDRDAAALAGLAGEVATLACDLEGPDWPLAGQSFAGIVVTNYLYRPHLPQLLPMLAPGGVLIYETFMVGNEVFGKPSNPIFLLQSQEMLAYAQSGGLQVLAYEEGRVAGARPAVVQRLCAVRPPAPVVLLQ